MRKIKAFIPAAGYGERLRPLTLSIPKPLLPILGKPVIENAVSSLSVFCEYPILINMHHLKEQMLAWAGSSAYADRVRLIFEQHILGTGGALKNATAFLCDRDFIVHNSDILTDLDIDHLLKYHFDSNNLATLAVHNHEKFNNVWIDNKGKLRHVGKEVLDDAGLCKIAFMGVAVYSPEFLDFLPEGNSSVVDAWLRAAAANRKIGTADFSGAAWTDIGSPDSYASAVFQALKEAGETLYLNNDQVDCSKITFGSNVVIEQGAAVEGCLSINNSIILPGAQLPDSTVIENVIAGAGFTVALASQAVEKMPFVQPGILSGFFGTYKDLHIRGIGAGGSDREYYRVSSKGLTAVLMSSSASDQDFFKYLEFTRYLRRYSLPVPELLALDEANKQALFEDLGDLSLYSWLKCRRSPAVIEEMYCRVLDILVLLHTVATEHSSECPGLQQTLFDHAHLRWETDYFLERFINGIRNMNEQGNEDLLNDFERLAARVESFSKTVLHRDFQSQNIMVTKGHVPRLIDYQGCRMGPHAYDIASMLWDPYYRLEDNMRENLITYYIYRMRQASPSFEEESFRDSILCCRLQRHMQALGAYGFLSKIKGKKYFMKHVPLALEYLKQEAELARKDYPALYSLVMKLT